MINNRIFNGICCIMFIVEIEFNGANIDFIGIIDIDIATINEMWSQLCEISCQLFFRNRSFK